MGSDRRLTRIVVGLLVVAVAIAESPRASVRAIGRCSPAAAAAGQAAADCCCASPVAGTCCCTAPVAPLPEVPAAPSAENLPVAKSTVGLPFAWPIDRPLGMAASVHPHRCTAACAVSTQARLCVWRI